MVEPQVGRAPERRALVGRFFRLEQLVPEIHLAALCAASHGDPATEQLWTYMPYGPFADQAATIAKHGGPDAIVARGDYGYSPAPR